MMTRQEAIDRCLAHWEWVRDTGAKDKSKCPNAPDALAACWFCEYAGTCARGLGKDCSGRCPGFGYWARGTGHCMDNTRYKDVQTSLYQEWDHAKNKKARKLWAGRVVWMAWLISEDVEGKE